MDFDDPPLLGGDLELSELLRDPYHVILPSGHRLAKRRAVPLAELAD
jgi:DNA-binding transcriptional LysR family regulator